MDLPCDAGGLASMGAGYMPAAWVCDGRAWARRRCSGAAARCAAATRSRRLAALSVPTDDDRSPRSAAATPPPGDSPPSGHRDLALADELGRVVAILGGASRKGSWEPPARLQVLALMGGVELDFREADLLEGETVVEVLAVMGGVNIVVPPDIDVEASGVGFLGGFGSLSSQAKDAEGRFPDEQEVLESLRQLRG